MATKYYNDIVDSQNILMSLITHSHQNSVWIDLDKLFKMCFNYYLMQKLILNTISNKFFCLHWIKQKTLSLIAKNSVFGRVISCKSHGVQVVFKIQKALETVNARAYYGSF